MSPNRPAVNRRALRLHLFVAGEAPNSVSAVRRLRALLEAHPSLSAELEIIDVLKHPELGLASDVLVTPTLIKSAPLPERRVIGNLKDTAAVLAALGLEPTDAQ